MIKQQLNIIDKWKAILKTSDISIIGNIIHEKATFFSPVVFTPQKGKILVVEYLTSAVKMFNDKNFKYTKSIAYGNVACEEFEARFGNIIVNGIDLITIKDNLIFEFKVFLRPLRGIQVVWEEMRKNLKP